MSDNKILAAVKQLDGANDNHWTADGLPRLETVRMLASDPSLTREQVEKAAPDFKRPKQAAAAPTPPAAPAAPPAPEPPAAPAAAEPAGTDTGVRGDLGPATPAVPVAPAAIEGAGGPVPPEDVEGKRQPQPEPLPTAPAADGLPTAAEPTATEGAPGVGLTADEVSGRSGPGGKTIPEIAEGTTERGFNAMNSEADDLRDALATVAPSPNAPTSLGGPKGPDELDGLDADGLTTAADVAAAAARPSLDRGHAGDPASIPALQAELKNAEARSEKLRAQADKVSGLLNEAASEESRIRAMIEAATPRTGHMEAVQGFFAAQDRMAEQQAAARQAVIDSGIDLKALALLTQRSPLDASFAAPPAPPPAMG